MQDKMLRDDVEGLLAGDALLMADPFPTWNELRVRHPVWGAGGAVLVSRYHDVKELLGDNNVFYSRAKSRHMTRYERARQTFRPAEQAAFDYVLDNEFTQLVRLDPPGHQRLRRTVQAPFSARRLAREMEETVSKRANVLLVEASESGPVIDFKKIAYTLPLMVLGDMLGIALSDLEDVHSWTHTISRSKFNAHSGALALEAEHAYRGLNGYIDGLIDHHRRSETAGGIVRALLEAVDSGVMSEVDARGMLELLIFAGHETTSNLLSIGVMELLRHRDQWEALCSAPSLIDQAVEELLRYVSPVNFLQYVAAIDRTVDGYNISEGDAIIGVLAAANRDPEVFGDPDRLDITRRNSKDHIALGFGPHFCLGASLARMEASILIRHLTERYPGSTLIPGQLEWGGSAALRTPLTLPIQLRRG